MQKNKNDQFSKKNIEIFFHQAGGGHEATAKAIATAMTQKDNLWNVSLVNVSKLGSEQAWLKAIFCRLESIYQKMLRSNWMSFHNVIISALRFFAPLLEKKILKVLAKKISISKPDLIISTIPVFNDFIYKALKNYNPTAELVTVVTDFAEPYSNFWISNSQSEIKLILGTEKLLAQAQEKNYPKENIFMISGLPLHPMFYKKIEINQGEARERIGLKKDLITGIVLFGGYGSPDMKKIALKLNDLEDPFQLLFICGNNAVLKKELTETKTSYPKAVLGFTDNIPYYMQLCDFMIGKPGPGSISEAIQMGLPLILEGNWKTMVQERYNVEWVKEHDLGIVLKSFKDINQAMKILLHDSTLQHYKYKVMGIKNRGVFEIIDIIESILK